MTDDPREVLMAAGVECAEVDDWRAEFDASVDCEECGHPLVACTDEGFTEESAILALARLAAEYKWTAEHRLVFVQAEGEPSHMVPTERSFQEVFDLGEFYREEHNV